MSAPRKILVIDDHVDTCELMAEMLRNRGHDVSAHVTAADALHAAETFQPDAVIVDLVLPDLDGIELVRRLRAQVARAATIIVLTGHVRAETSRSSMEAGADVFLGKPVTRDRLLEALRAPRADLT